jgi:hypothetical protein
MTITLPPEIESRLHGQATRLGIEATEYAMRLIEEGLAKPAPDQATLDLLERWDREQATDDPEEIARRQKEVEEFMEGMNRNRLEMEGPNARKIYP